MQEMMTCKGCHIEDYIIEQCLFLLAMRFWPVWQIS